MTYDEFLSWADYRNLRGSFNVGRRIECSTALIVHDARVSAGRKSDMHDLLLHEDEIFTDPAEIAAMMGAKTREQ